MFNHFREELRDARKNDPRLEENIRARNVILVCAAAIAPLTALMWIVILLLWDNVAEPPGLMYDGASFYPVLSLAAMMLALPMHKRRQYFGAGLVAILPLLCVLLYIGAAIHWAFG